MNLITITETGHFTDQPNARLSFDHGAPQPITITDPFSDAEEERLRWYFEEHLRFPIGSPAFHQLHWEALCEPGRDPFVLHAPMVRRSTANLQSKLERPASPTINLLVVTARPHGRRDVGYRTISRPLIEGLRQVQAPVRVDIVRPGTYRTVVEHLRRTQQALALYVECKDRYHQARTYHNLGMVTQEQWQWGQARDYFLKDLAITAEFDDKCGLAITLRGLGRLWQTSRDTDLPHAIASILRTTPEDVETRLSSLLSEET